MPVIFSMSSRESFHLSFVRLQLLKNNGRSRPPTQHLAWWPGEAGCAHIEHSETRAHLFLNFHVSASLLLSLCRDVWWEVSQALVAVLSTLSTCVRQCMKTLGTSHKERTMTETSMSRENRSHRRRNYCFLYAHHFTSDV